MKKIIGFAHKFYTLWNYEGVEQFRTDAYGNHHYTHTLHKFHYIKNISMDLNVVLEAYPGVQIDEGLRGKSGSFEREDYPKLPPSYFWHGKYSGRTVDDVIETDFSYCLWAAENMGSVREYIKAHPKYIAHFEAIRQEHERIIASVPHIKAGDVVELEFTSNGFNAYWSDGGKISYKDSEDVDGLYDRCHADAQYGDLSVRVHFDGGMKKVSGMYPYIMPVVNGKAQKTRGKKITVTVNSANPPILYGCEVSQYISVK